MNNQDLVEMSEIVASAEAPAPIRAPFGKGQPVDLGLRRPCPCGSGRRLKSCCYNTVRRGAGWVVYRTDYQTPIFSEFRDEEGNKVDGVLQFGVLHTYKAASEIMITYREKLGPEVPLGLDRMTIEEAERVAEFFMAQLNAPQVVINYAEEIVNQEELDRISAKVKKEFQKIVELPNHQEAALEASGLIKETLQ